MDFPIKTLDHLKPILRGFRRSKGLTQKALAEQLGITQQTYAELEANPASATLGRLITVFRLLGVEVVLRELVAEPAEQSLVSGEISHGGDKAIQQVAAMVDAARDAPPTRRQPSSQRAKTEGTKAASVDQTGLPDPDKSHKSRAGQREYLVLPKKSYEAW